ncbi:hypothetical protein Pmani_011090 [Petrolisthes manimaculis]|uniref:Cuticle protein n=1 Tax=Petrolisthes manimaculis TaxID=1843537 RepID=A0AAE1Q0C7_9EUCA|nr:hypothetical protein Pmani_011090 [Petrolisthes manimaculis]
MDDTTKSHVQFTFKELTRMSNSRKTIKFTSFQLHKSEWKGGSIVCLRVVVLAVIGVCSASYQAPIVHPRYTGPVAATVPAGVDGQIVQVPDTHEVMAARNKFFATYNEQLAEISSLRYGTPNYSPSGPVYTHVPSYSAPIHPQPYSAPAYPQAYSAPAPSYGTPAAGYAPAPVRDTPEVAAAKAEFFRTFDRQAAAAAAAPDDYTEPSYTHTY